NYLFDKNLNIFQVEFLGKLLKEEAYILDAAGKESFSVFEKALICLEYFETNSDVYDLRLKEEIQTLKNKLNNIK
ncbi:MAG: hypothetical protein AAGK97_00795, partial [Bacteroidota bacterium]